MGTVSGELAVYKVIRNPSNDQELQVKSTGMHQCYNITIAACDYTMMQ